MRKYAFLVVATILATGFLLHWAVARSMVRAFAFASGSQIFIHGAPVCVYSGEEGVYARVGPCDPEGNEDGAARVLPGQPFGHGPGMNLPPGHPPVGEGMIQERGNLIRI